MEQSPTYSGRTRAGPDDLLNASAVARLRGCARNTVHLAIRRGELAAVAVLGPDGEPATWAVRRWVALAWTPRPEGRPRGVAAAAQTRPRKAVAGRASRPSIMHG